MAPRDPAALRALALPALILVAGAIASAQDVPPRMPLPSTTPQSDRFFRILEIAALADPALDEAFPLERAALACEAQLRALLAAARAGDAAALVAIAGDAEFVIAYATAAPIINRQRATTVRRVASPSGSSATAAATAAGRLRAGFADPQRCDVEVAIVGLSADERGGLRGEAVVTITGPAGEGIAAQRNERWAIDWERGAEGGPRLRAVRAIESTLVTAAPVLVDVTPNVLAGSPEVQTRVHTDAGDRYESTDRLWGADLLGHTGLAVGDVNGDGRDDLFVAQQGGVPNMLLVQQPDGTVRDVAADAGVDHLDLTRGCLLADLDGDGDPDLALSVRNATVLFENVTAPGGPVRFGSEPRLLARTNSASEFYSIAAADVDGNGFLDLYSTRFGPSYGAAIPVPYFDANNGPPNHLLSNLGEWRFADVTGELGLDENNRRFSLAAAWQDIEPDGDLDLYVANDFGQANLYVQENGVFTDRADERGATNMAAGMGVTWGDYDADGHVDLYVSNMHTPIGERVLSSAAFRPGDDAAQRELFRGQVMGNALFRGLGDGRFERVDDAMRRGIEGWSWGSMFVDLDNDGHLDLLVPNGNLSQPERRDVDGLFWRRVAPASPLELAPEPDYQDAWTAVSWLMLQGRSWAGHQRHVTYRNLGDGTFADVSRLSGFGMVEDGRAMAMTDWDRDGDVDVWIASRTAPTLRLLANTTITASDADAAARWVALRLEGVDAERDAAGATVLVTTRDAAGGRATLQRTMRHGEGYLGGRSRWLHVGLGDAAEIVDVAVRWPGGAPPETFTGVTAGARIPLAQGAGQARASTGPGPVVLPEASGGDAAPATDKIAQITLAEPLALPRLEMAGPRARYTSDAVLGTPHVLVLWSADVAEGDAGLDELARAAPALAEAGIEAFAVCMDGPAPDGEELAHVSATPLVVDLVDLAQQEILGRAEDLRLPTTIVIDELGLVRAIQRGGIDPAGARAALDPGPPAGRILLPPRRSYANLLRGLARNGHRDAARLYQAILRARGGR